MRRTFNVDDRVKFDLDGTPQYKGTGTVLGLSMDNIIQFYIVLLDVPIKGEKAIVIPETLMKPVCAEMGYNNTIGIQHSDTR